MNTYLLDASVFVQANNEHYGMDFCPAFWQWLEIANRNGIVLSIQEVTDELKDPDLTNWKNKSGYKLLLPAADAAHLQAFNTVQKCLQSLNYSTGRIRRFMRGADPHLIAYALEHRYTIVTHEKPASEADKRVKIPDVCNKFGIECIDPFEMLRREKARFILENQQP